MFNVDLIALMLFDHANRICSEIFQFVLGMAACTSQRSLPIAAFQRRCMCPAKRTIIGPTKTLILHRNSLGQRYTQPRRDREPNEARNTEKVRSRFAL